MLIRWIGHGVSLLGVVMLLASHAIAQSITSLQPASWQPGVVTQVKVQGSKLPPDLRVITNRNDVKVVIANVTESEATITVDVPKQAMFGPIGLWFAKADGPFSSRIALVDDLVSVADNGNNHSVAMAQSVDVLCAIDGISDGVKSDHYRFHVEGGKRVAFEIVTQAIHSKMDPIVKLLRTDGSVLQVADDDSVGPDCRFSYTFSEAGDYILQVGESHYVAGGAYHLRIGDFPIVHHAFPLAVQTGANAKIGFTGNDASSTVEAELTIPMESADLFQIVPARFTDGKSAAWGTVLSCAFSQHVESPSAATVDKPSLALHAPVGISGQLRQQGEQDNYWLQFTKGQTLRFTSRTRSLGCATMLHMQLMNAAGAKIAETSVNDMDEWSFDATIPEDGEYRLELRDLLRRGGDDFGYWVEIKPLSGFSIALKADPNAKQWYAVEETSGGFVADLQVSRLGYTGEIDLSLIDGDGLRLLNPRIASGANQHRAIVLANEGWTKDRFGMLRIRAQATNDNTNSCEVSSFSLRRAIEPFVITPERFANGLIAIAGAPTSPQLFELNSSAKVLLDRAEKTHTMSVNVKRLNKDFKAGISLDGSQLPPGWTLATKSENDVLNVTITRPDVEVNQPADNLHQLQLLAYTELPDRVRWEKVHLPVSWIDRPARIEVYPPAIELDGPKTLQQIVVTGFDAANQPRDWTHEIQIESSNPAVAKVQGCKVMPVANGTTEIVIKIGEMKQAIPVKVSNFETTRPVAFESEVLVALSKQGCNSGACHGSPSGKGSFRLSLRAFDRVLDELTLIREDYGRRVNPLDPDQSLLLLKPLMKVAHGGGTTIKKDDIAYKILRDWIAEGAKADPAGAPRCIKLEVYPNAKRVLKRSFGTQQLVATAHFSNGTKRDVTRLVSFDSTNTEVATVDNQGLVTPRDRGETVILVRYLEHIESVPLMFVDELPGFEWQQPKLVNYIDQLVTDKLKQLQYLPAPTCSDSEFLRRVYMDVIGILPTPEETTAFLADSDLEKRSKLIDRLLEREEYPKFWALKWGDLLKMTSKLVGPDAIYKYHRWVEQAIRSNMPYDEFAKQLLSASGSTLSNPAANFYRTSTDMNECVETVSQVFLGARLQCAKCHNHPFERWTQDNYYGLGAFFNRLQRKASQRPGEAFVWTAATGEVTQPRTGELMKPWLPQVGSVDAKEGEDRRLTFVAWLIDGQNPYFAKIEANRIWKQLFARGIVDPIDDFRDSNPPSNEPLLDALAKDFVEHGYDRKQLIKRILNSATYQASSKTTTWNESDKMYFSHQSPRMHSAEQILDAINHVTGLSQIFSGLPIETKATHLPAPDIAKNSFLKVFGQPERSTVCACERADDSNLGMAIELFNGPLIYEKLRDANNRFRKLQAAGKSPQEVINELYLSALCRPPTESEMSAALQHCTSRSDLNAGYEDLCWVLLNTDEFLFQH